MKENGNLRDKWRKRGRAKRREGRGSRRRMRTEGELEMEEDNKAEEVRRGKN